MVSWNVCLGAIVCGSVLFLAGNSAEVSVCVLWRSICWSWSVCEAEVCFGTGVSIEVIMNVVRGVCVFRVVWVEAGVWVGAALFVVGRNVC